jgi:hypothetical protein
MLKIKLPKNNYSVKNSSFEKRGEINNSIEKKKFNRMNSAKGLNKDKIKLKI